MNSHSSKRYLALSGGVGGAKIVLGLSAVLRSEELTVVANTGDDFEHLGLHICPDIDTVLYSLADWSNKELGWGQAEESWTFLGALKRLGGEDWFSLGDKDMATHILRTQMLRSGASLSEVIEELRIKMRVAHRVVPMSDDRVRTEVHCKKGGTLSFQHYFVRERCKPEVSGFNFLGVKSAKPSPGFLSALSGSLNAVFICPSNPFVSVAPILKIPGVLERLRAVKVPIIVVSNIVGGEAIKGPAAKMMTELGMPQTALGVAKHYVKQYGDLITGFIIDTADAHLEKEIVDLGLETIVTKSVMVTLKDKVALAEEVLAFATTLEA